MKRVDRLVSRRSFIKKTMYYTLGIVGSIGLSGVYSRWVEPHFIETTHIDISLPGLPKSFHDFRICHFSDLHLGFSIEVSDLPSLVELIQSNHPDCICFTGDLFDKDLSGVSKTAKYLSQLDAPYGKYAVLGNHDNWGNRESVQSVWRKANFKILHNKHDLLRKQTDSLYIAGVDDPWVGKPDIQKALKGIPKDACTILLAHEPDFADEFSRFPIDLQLSGHSHGGQVRIPLIGALYTPPYSSKYPNGLYQVPNTPLQVYTTRGIGMTRLPLRFNCRPELTMITLKSG